MQHPLSQRHIRTLKFDFIWVNKMTKAAFLLDLSSCPLVVFCCSLSYVDPLLDDLKSRRTQSRLRVLVSVTWHEGGQCRLHQYDLVPWTMSAPNVVSAPVWCQRFPALSVAAQNHNSAPSAPIALFVVRGNYVFPRLLVRERSLRLSPTGYHSNDGGSAP